MTPQKTADGAYFVVDTLAFENRLAVYDPIVATQTIAAHFSEEVVDEPLGATLGSPRRSLSPGHPATLRNRAHKHPGQPRIECRSRDVRDTP